MPNVRGGVHSIEQTIPLLFVVLQYRILAHAPVGTGRIAGGSIE